MTDKFKLKARQRLLLANAIGHAKLAMTAETVEEAAAAINAARISLIGASASFGTGLIVTGTGTLDDPHQVTVSAGTKPKS